MSVSMQFDECESDAPIGPSSPFIAKVQYSTSRHTDTDGPAARLPGTPTHFLSLPAQQPPAATTWTSVRELRRWPCKGMKFRFCGDLDVSRHNQIRAVGPC
jgi:hypothetical protein